MTTVRAPTRRICVCQAHRAVHHVARARAERVAHLAPRARHICNERYVNRCPRRPVARRRRRAQLLGTWKKEQHARRPCVAVAWLASCLGVPVSSIKHAAAASPNPSMCLPAPPPRCCFFDKRVAPLVSFLRNLTYISVHRTPRQHRRRRGHMSRLPHRGHHSSNKSIIYPITSIQRVHRTKSVPPLRCFNEFSHTR
jgi:hypothetical protein